MSTENNKDEIQTLFNLTLTLHHLNKDVERKFGLSLVQLFVLLRLRSLPATSSQDLAGAVGIQPSTLTQTIRRLQRKEFIFVAVDPRDSRKKLISLTREGKNAIEVVSRELKEVFRNHDQSSHTSFEESLSDLIKVRTSLGRLSTKWEVTRSKASRQRSGQVHPEPKVTD